jgi:hypothetical protein
MRWTRSSSAGVRPLLGEARVRYSLVGTLGDGDGEIRLEATPGDVVLRALPGGPAATEVPVATAAPSGPPWAEGSAASAWSGPATPEPPPYASRIPR